MARPPTPVDGHGEREAVPLQELAERLGVAPPRIEEWERLGLLRRGGDGSFSPEVIERARILRYATDRGIRAEDIARGLDRMGGDELGRFVRLLGGPRGRSHSLEEAAELAGLDVEMARRLRIESGAGDGELFDEDVESLRRAALALGSGFPAEALVQVARVWGDALGARPARGAAHPSP